VKPNLCFCFGKYFQDLWRSVRLWEKIIGIKIWIMARQYFKRNYLGVYGSGVFQYL